MVSLSLAAVLSTACSSSRHTICLSRSVGCTHLTACSRVHRRTRARSLYNRYHLAPMTSVVFGLEKLFYTVRWLGWMQTSRHTLPGLWKSVCIYHCTRTSAHDTPGPSKTNLLLLAHAGQTGRFRPLVLRNRRRAVLCAIFQDSVPPPQQPAWRHWSGGDTTGSCEIIDEEERRGEFQGNFATRVRAALTHPTPPLAPLQKRLGM